MDPPSASDPSSSGAFWARCTLHSLVSSLPSRLMRFPSHCVVPLVGGTFMLALSRLLASRRSASKANASWGLGALSVCSTLSLAISVAGIPARNLSKSSDGCIKTCCVSVSPQPCRVSSRLCHHQSLTMVLWCPTSHYDKIATTTICMHVYYVAIPLHDRGTTRRGPRTSLKPRTKSASGYPGSLAG